MGVYVYEVIKNRHTIRKFRQQSIDRRILGENDMIL